MKKKKMTAVLVAVVSVTESHILYKYVQTYT
jgi:hypothetical protein